MEKEKKITKQDIVNKLRGIISSFGKKDEWAKVRGNKNYETGTFKEATGESLKERFDDNGLL